MAITLATGTTVAIASTYGTGFTISAITNANPAVATLSAAHGVIVGDIIEVISGWDLLTNRLVRVSAVATNDVTLEGIDTSNTTNYPASTGAGTGREVTAWATITQVKAVASGGGEQQYADITTITDRVAKNIPTIRAAQNIDLTVFDDPTLSWYATVVTAADTQALTGMRIVFPNSSRLLANGYFSIQKTPVIAVNEPLSHAVNFSAAAEPMRYST